MTELEDWNFNEWCSRFELSQDTIQVLTANQFTNLLSLGSLAYFHQHSKDEDFFEAAPSQTEGPRYTDLSSTEVGQLYEAVQWILELLQRYNFENPTECHSSLSSLIEQQLRDCLQEPNPYKTLQIMREQPAEYEVRKKKLHGGQLATVCFGLDVLSPSYHPQSVRAAERKEPHLGMKTVSTTTGDAEKLVQDHDVLRSTSDQELGSLETKHPIPETLRFSDEEMITLADFYKLSKSHFSKMYRNWNRKPSGIVFLPPSPRKETSQLESVPLMHTIHQLITKILITIDEKAFVIHRGFHAGTKPGKSMVEDIFSTLGSVVRTVDMIVIQKRGIILLEIRDGHEPELSTANMDPSTSQPMVQTSVHPLLDSIKQLEYITSLSCSRDAYIPLGMAKTVTIVDTEDAQDIAAQSSPFILDASHIELMTGDIDEATAWWKSVWSTDQEGSWTTSLKLPITGSANLDQFPSILPLLVGLKCYQTSAGICRTSHTIYPSSELSNTHCLLLTPEQTKVWQGGKRQILSGVPGSGKTILIQCKAIEQLWRENHPVLILVPWFLVPTYTNFFQSELDHLCQGNEDLVQKKMKDLTIISFGSPFEQKLHLDSDEMCLGLFDGLQSMFDSEIRRLEGHDLFIDDIQSLLTISLKNSKKASDAVDAEFSSTLNFLFHKLIPRLLDSNEDSYHWYSYSSWASVSGFHSSDIYNQAMPDQVQAMVSENVFFRSCAKEESMIRKELNVLTSEKHFAHQSLESCCRSTANIQHLMSHCQPSDGWVEDWQIGHEVNGPKVRIIENSNIDPVGYVLHAVKEEIEFYRNESSLPAADIKVIDMPALGANIQLLTNYLNGCDELADEAAEENNYLYFDKSGYTFDGCHQRNPSHVTQEHVACAFPSLLSSREYMAVIMLVNFSSKDRSLDHFHINSMHKSMFTAASRAALHLSVVLVDPAETWKSQIHQCQECQSACEFITYTLDDLGSTLEDEVDQLKAELDDILDSTNTHYWTVEFRNTVADAFKLARGQLCKLHLERDEYNNLMFLKGKLLPSDAAGESGSIAADVIDKYISDDFIREVSNLTVACSGLEDIESEQESFEQSKELHTLCKKLQIDICDLAPKMSIIKMSIKKMHQQLQHGERAKVQRTEDTKKVLLRYQRTFVDQDPVRCATECLRDIEDIQFQGKTDDADSGHDVPKEWFNLIQQIKDQVSKFVKCCTLQAAALQASQDVESSSGYEPVDKMISQFRDSQKSDDPNVLRTVVETFLETTSPDELQKCCDYLQNQGKQISFDVQNMSPLRLRSSTAEISKKLELMVSGFTESMQRFIEMTSASGFTKSLQQRKTKCEKKLHKTFVKWQTKFAQVTPYLAKVIGYLALVIQIIEKYSNQEEEEQETIQALKEKQHKSEGLLRAILQTFLLKFQKVDQVSEWSEISTIATLQLDEHVLNLLAAMQQPIPPMRLLHRDQVSLLNSA